MGLLSFLAPGIGGLIEGLASNGDNSNDALIGDNGLINNPVGAWDKFKNGATNSTNKEIANENLQYQRERNEIEDARYEEETAYNRAFAENERDYNRAFQEDERAYQRAFAEDERAYNRALQQTLFEREDTALERQASSLSSMGINPLSQQLNGLGAGQALSPSTAGSSSSSAAAAPSASGRGGSALHNDFKMQDMGVLQALAPLATLANTINQVATGQGQRDLLQAQVEKQKLDNFITAYENGIWDWNNPYFKYYQGQATGPHFYNRKNESHFWNIQNQSLNYNSNKREFDYKSKNNIFDSQPDWAKNMNYLVSDDFFQSAEKALTRGSKLFDKAFDNSLDSDNNKKKFNPFETFIHLFF